MPPRNDILKDIRIGWTTREGEVIGKVKSSSISDDGFACTITLNDIQKEKKMNKLQGRNIDKIEIRRYGNNVVAKAYAKSNITDCSGYVYDHDGNYVHVHDQGWSLVGEASATCGPNDIFDFNIGAKLAFDRLYEGYDMTPKPKRKPYDGLIYIHEYPGCGLAERAVYKVVDGYIANCWYAPKEPYIFDDMSDKALTAVIRNEMYGGPYNVSAHFVRYDKTKA